MLNPHHFESINDKLMRKQRNKITRSNKRIKLIKELNKLNHIQTAESQLLMRDSLVFILKQLEIK